MLQYTILHYTTQTITTITLHKLQLQLHFLPLHILLTPLFHFTRLRDIPLRCNSTTLYILCYILFFNIPLHYTYNHNYNYATLHYTALGYATLYHTTSLYTITPLQINHKYTTLITLHYNSNSTILQLQPHYTILHPILANKATTSIFATTLGTKI